VVGGVRALTAGLLGGADCLLMKNKVPIAAVDSG
jgi:hypothetical protein